MHTDDDIFEKLSIEEESFEPTAAKPEAMKPNVPVAPAHTAPAASGTSKSTGSAPASPSHAAGSGTSSASHASGKLPPAHTYDNDDYLDVDYIEDDDIFEDLDMEDKLFTTGVNGKGSSASSGKQSLSGTASSKEGSSAAGTSASARSAASAAAAGSAKPAASGTSRPASSNGTAAGKAGVSASGRTGSTSSDKARGKGPTTAGGFYGTNGTNGTNGRKTASARERGTASPKELNTVESSLDSRRVSREKAQKKKSRIRRIILWTLVEAITLCAIFVYGYVLRNWNLIARPEVKLDAIENHNISLDKKKEMEGYWTIAVFGVDGRSSEVVGRGLNSDVIIIANINKDTGEIRMVSVFRDTYLNISDSNSFNKINQAYAVGGPEQALAALNKNLDLNIQNYVTFNWKAVADGINILGGVDDIPISKAELYYINAYITETVKATGVGSYQLKNTGEQHLDGIQAVAYGRLRYMDNDYARTERQRRIIKACFEKAKKANFSVLNNIMVVCFPQVATNIGFNDIIAMAQNIGDYNISETGGFPWQRGEAIIGKRGDMVIPATLESNVRYLHEFLFGDTDYTPSDAVLRYSQKIKEDSNYYKEAKFIESVATDGGVIQKPRAAGGGGGGGSSKRTEEEEETEEEGVTLGVDENGNYIYPTDEDGNIVIPTDADGNVVYPTDEDGNIIKESAIRPTDVVDGDVIPGEGDPDETDEPLNGPGGAGPVSGVNTNPTRETTRTDNGDEPVISPAGGSSPGSSSTTPGGDTYTVVGGGNSETVNGEGPGSSAVTPGTSTTTDTGTDSPSGSIVTEGGPGSISSGSTDGPGGSSSSSEVTPGSSSTPAGDSTPAPGSLSTDSGSSSGGPGDSAPSPVITDSGSGDAGPVSDAPVADGPG